MRGVEVIWSSAEAAKIEDLFMRATGSRCPCEGGRRCPILGDPEPSHAEKALPLVECRCAHDRVTMDIGTLGNRGG